MKSEILPEVNSYSKATQIKTGRYWQKNRQMGATEREPGTDPQRYNQLTLDKRAKQHNGGKTVSSTNGAGTTGHLHAKNPTRRRPHTLLQELTQNGHFPDGPVA